MSAAQIGALWPLVLLGTVAFAIVFGIVRGRVTAVRENAFNQSLRAELEESARKRQAFADARDAAFAAGFLPGRRWLAEFIAEAERVQDTRDRQLQFKSHPALKSAEVVKEVKREKRELQARVKFLEYQLRSYEEYFPALEEFRESLLDERVPLAAGADNLDAIELADPVQLILNRDEWNALTPSARNQLALDRYVARRKSDWEIGLHYERYIGYLRESAGFAVTYRGAIFRLEDMGQDLICKKGPRTEIVQAKCWSTSKTIHEKHVFQLFGTSVHYRLGHPHEQVAPVFVTTTQLSAVALEVAELLEVRVETVALPTMYPLIKCNINAATRERIYHLPFDQMYDRTQIRQPGECFVTTVAEAEEAGFRRAWRYHLAAAETSE